MLVYLVNDFISQYNKVYKILYYHKGVEGMPAKQPINLRRILLYPTLIFILFIITGEVIAYYYFTNRLASVFHTNTEMTTEVFSKRLSDGIIAKEEVIDRVDEELLTIARIVLQNRATLDNDYLYELTQISSAIDIYWYDPTGLLLYDARNTYVGWTPQPNDPIDQFIQSGETQYIEAIRQSTDEEVYYKFVYIRDSDGYFVQVGIRAEDLLAHLATYDQQNQINQFMQEYNNIFYVSIVAPNYQIRASTNEDEIGEFCAASQLCVLALAGETTSNHPYSDQQRTTVFEVYTPIYDENGIESILIIGYSRALYIQARNSISFFFAFIGFFLISTYFAFLVSQVIKPLRDFNRYIRNLNINSGNKEGIHPIGDPVAGLYQTVDNLSTRIYESNQENVALNSELARLAYFDFLTKLPNRLSFNDVISEKIEKNKPFAVLYIDLDNFKVYNDTKGHTFGDKILLAIAEKINARIDDRIFAARHGGDEFLIMYEYKKAEEIEKFVEKIGDIFEEGVYIEEELYMLDYSLGVSLYPQDGKDAEDLIRKADVAMYLVKKIEEKPYAFYDEKMDAEIEENAETITALKNALRNEEFKLVYQPKVNIHTNQITGIEALLRLKNSSLSPGKFIPIAEQSGLIGAIGRQVIKMAIEQIAEWKVKIALMVPVSINVSSRQLEDPLLVEYIQHILKENRIEASLLSIEITETAIIDQSSRMIQALKQLRSMGIRIAIDDFGSGQASVNYLTRFEVDDVKLDKTFSDSYLNLENLPIFHAVVHLCKLLGFQVVAEGIETAEQIDLLKATNCQAAQGYFYYRPLEVEDLEKAYKENKKEKFIYE